MSLMSIDSQAEFAGEVASLSGHELNGVGTFALWATGSLIPPSGVESPQDRTARLTAEADAVIEGGAVYGEVQDGWFVAVPPAVLGLSA